MSATGSTTHYDLPVYAPNDITSWLTDFNGAMEKIDAAIYEASQMGVEVVQTTGTSTTSVMSQNAVTEAINNIPTPPSITIDQTTGQSTTSVMSQKAVTDALDAIPQIQLTSQEGFSDTIGASQRLVAKCGNPDVGAIRMINITNTNFASSEDVAFLTQVGGNIDKNVYVGTDQEMIYTGGNTFPAGSLTLTADGTWNILDGNDFQLISKFPVYCFNPTTQQYTNANVPFITGNVGLNQSIKTGYTVNFTSTQLKTAFENTTGQKIVAINLNRPITLNRGTN